MTSNIFSLKDRKVIVTGASSGIGATVARKVSELGGVCAITGRDKVRLDDTLQRLSGDGHITIPGDLESTDFKRDLVKETVRQLGPISGFVRCAGIEKTLPFRATDEEDLANVMEINFKSFWILCQEILRKGNYEASKLSVIGISSVAALYGTVGNSAYASSKGALVSLVRTLAMEYAPKGLRFNCICPGYVDTPMLEKLKGLYPSEEAFEETMKRLHPLGIGRPEDVAYAAVFLLGPGARWITGTIMNVDGGYSCQ